MSCKAYTNLYEGIFLLWSVCCQPRVQIIFLISLLALIYHFLVELIRMEEGPHNGSPHGFQFPQRFKNFLDILMVIAVWAILYSRILLYFATSALVRGR